MNCAPSFNRILLSVTVEQTIDPYKKLMILRNIWQLKEARDSNVPTVRFHLYEILEKVEQKRQKQIDFCWSL